jgi:hypothetical protein
MIVMDSFLLEEYVFLLLSIAEAAIGSASNVCLIEKLCLLAYIFRMMAFSSSPFLPYLHPARQWPCAL